MSTEQTYPVEVDGVGVFHVAKRTMRHEFRIQAEYSRLTEGVDTPTPNLEIMAAIFSVLKVLIVKAPDGWNLDAIDPLDQDEYAKLIRVHSAVRAKEDSFRRKPGQAGAGTGAADGAVPGVQVPATLPAASN